MFSSFNYIIRNIFIMWLKICYVLKNNKDKLLGYIHIPTKQDNFNEEIRWVQARQNGRKKEKLTFVTPDPQKEECSSPGEEEEDIKFECGEGVTYLDTDGVSDAKIAEQDFTDLGFHERTPSSTSNENESDDWPNKDFSVEIRYEPKIQPDITDEILRTPSPIEELPEEEDDNEEQNQDSDDDEEQNPDSGEENRCAYLEQISFNNKIRFIYSRRDDGDEEILTVPSRQEEFNRGIRHLSSSPKKDKSLNKTNSSQRFSSTRNDVTYTIPTNSADLKEIIYHQWLEKKKVQTKEEIKAKMLAQKKAAEQAEAEANERKTAAQKTYDAWHDSKTGKLLTEKEMKLKAKQAEKEKMEETLQRKKEAEKYFESWKREKDEKTKKMLLLKKKEEKLKDKESFNLKRQTSEEALKAFESWKTQKGKETAETKKREAEEKAKVGEEKLLAFEKKQEALRVYEQWKSNAKRSPRAISPQLIQSGRTIGSVVDAKLTKTNTIRSDADTKMPIASSVSKLWKMDIIPDLKVRKPNVMSELKARKPNAISDGKVRKPDAISDLKVRKPASVPISKVRKSDAITDKNVRKPNANLDAKPWKQKINSIAKIRKPIPNPDGKSQMTEAIDSSEKASIVKKSSFYFLTWPLFSYLLWRMLVCIVILYYLEKLLEELIFKGVDPCFKMLAECLTGFAESVAALRNETRNRQQGVVSCLSLAFRDYWNCSVPK